MSTQRKPSIVFVHGIWADSTCFRKVIPVLQAEGSPYVREWMLHERGPPKEQPEPL